MFLSQASGGQSLMLRHKRVMFRVNVVGNATASLVGHSSDAPDCIFLQTEGRDDVSAHDSGASFGTIQDNNSGASTMGVLVDASGLLGRPVKRIYSVSVSEAVTSTAGTVTSALKGASSSGITASGNVAFTVSGSAANLSADTVTYQVVLECLLDESN